MMNPYGRAKWDANIDAVVAEAARIAEHGGRIAVFVESSSAVPFEPAANAVVEAFKRAGVEPRCETVWYEDSASEGLPEGVRAWRSPHNLPQRAVSRRIVMGTVGSRARDGVPKERRERGLPHRFDMEASVWHRDTSDVWVAERDDWVDAGIPGGAASRLIALQTYEGETVAVLAASASAAVAALELGRGCVVAAGDAEQTSRIAAAVARVAAEAERAGV